MSLVVISGSSDNEKYPELNLWSSTVDVRSFRFCKLQCEIDVLLAGHMFSWGLGQDYLLTPCYDYKQEPNGRFGPLNPILKKTYVFLNSLFAEILSVFKDKFIHLGGDEVPLDCWCVNFISRFLILFPGQVRLD